MTEKKGIGKDQKQFTANGTNYKILTAEQGITAVRYFEYEKLKVQYCIDASFESIHAAIKESNDILNKVILGQNTGGKSVVHVITTLQQVAEKCANTAQITAGRLMYMMLICTLFIVVDGEDLTKWSLTDAENKINDWQAEGLGFEPFFVLGLDFFKQLNEIFTRLTDAGSQGEN